MRKWMLVWLGVGCRGEHPTCDQQAQLAAPPEDGVNGDNLLILIIDDAGVDKIGAYGLHDTPSSTPRLDALIDQGVRFDRAYASPVCSPSRASMLTGRHPSRHGIGSWILPSWDRFNLPDDEITFAEVARDAGWSTGAVGKWHLSVYDGHDAELDPLEQGFDHFHGLLSNPPDALDPDGQTRGYWHWQKDDDGELSYSDEYLTTVQVDDALELVATLPEPWVIYVGFSAVHVPLDLPPANLAGAAASDAEPDVYDVVFEALDTELGRLLDGMGDDLQARTTILTMGDNGTPSAAMRPPWDPERGKGTVYEGGIRVPLSINGPLVAEPGTVSEALVHAVDVFATVADFIGVDVHDVPATVDGISLLPMVADPGSPGPRRCLLSELFEPDGVDVHRDALARALVERDTKLIEVLHERDELTRVGVDPSQEADADDPDARRRLRDELRAYEKDFR